MAISRPHRPYYLGEMTWPQVEEYLKKIVPAERYCVYIETDSNYIRLEPIVQKIRFNWIGSYGGW